MIRRYIKKGTAYILISCLTFVMAVSPVCAGSMNLSPFKIPIPGNKKLTMDMARALALEESLEYFQVEQSISTKEAQLKSAIKSIAVKQKDRSTFRWTPLLSFKFPTKPDETTAAEEYLKPIKLQVEIDEATHKLTDTKLGIYEEINNLYVEIVTLEKTIEFNEGRLASLKEGLERNQARLLTGEATQGDVDKLQSKVDSTTEKIANDKGTLAADLNKLSTKLGIDVTTGYDFETPYLDADIPRDALAPLIQYTLDRDQSYYVACQDATTARVTLVTHYSQYKKKYGSDANAISSYVTMVLNGQRLTGSVAKGFKKDYDEFIKQIDSYWQGKKKILFIKIPREWFKGSLDGTRFTEEEPYALYESAMGYSEALSAQRQTEAEIEESVIANYENYVKLKKAYFKSIDDVDKAGKNLEDDLQRNQMGLVSFEEIDSETEEYENLQNDLYTNLKAFSEALYSFDRLTCGGVTAYLSGTDSSLSAAPVGTSYVEEEVGEGATYYIKQIVSQCAFQLTVNIPKDFPAEITDFELWCDNQLIGKRTKVKDSLRHLLLTTESISECKIRFYNGEKFVDDVKIDPNETSGPLPIVIDRNIVKLNEDEIGIIEVVRGENNPLMTVKLNITEDPDVASYTVKTEDGISLSGSRPVPNNKSFRHLTITYEGLAETKVDLFDKDGNRLYGARLDMASYKVKKDEPTE